MNMEGFEQAGFFSGKGKKNQTLRSLKTGRGGRSGTKKCAYGFRQDHNRAEDLDTGRLEGGSGSKRRSEACLMEKGTFKKGDQAYL